MFQIVRPGPEHRAFIESTFTRSAQEGWPWSLVPRAELLHDFQRRTRRPGVRIGVAVLEADPDSYLGWAACDPSGNEVIAAYTSGAYRTKGSFQPRVATSLVTAMGVDLTRPTTVRYWTPAAETLAKRPGYHLHPTTETR